MHPFLRFVALMSLIACADPQPRRTGTINRDPSCKECTIVAERILSLGSPGDSVLLSINSSALRDKRGNYIVKGFERHNLVVFDSTGRYLRAVGRSGNGPEEFLQIIAFAPGRGDSLLVFQQMRVTVLTPSFEFARSFDLPHTFEGATPLPNGNLLVRQRNDPRAPPIIVLDPSGEKIGVLGDVPSDARPGCYGCFDRLPAVSQKRGNIWLGTAGDYSVQLLDSTGVLVKTLTQTVEWFRPWDPDQPAMSYYPLSSPSRLSRIFEDSSEQLWMQAAVVDPSYKPPAQPAVPPGGAGVDPNMRLTMIIRHQDSLTAAASVNHIEVIDTRSDRLVVSAILDDGMYLMQPGLAYRKREGDSGIVLYDLYKLSIKPKK